jgi:formate dehydrogenase subunit delta
MPAQIEHLIKMANQIAANFAYEQDKDKAARAVADHILRFWSPLMKREIVACANEGNSELSPLARAAVGLLPMSGS